MMEALGGWRGLDDSISLYVEVLSNYVVVSQALCSWICRMSIATRHTLANDLFFSAAFQEEQMKIL